LEILKRRSNLLQDGHGSTLGTTASDIATLLAPGPMELGSINQTNGCMQCGGKGYRSYFCATPEDWKQGDLMKKPEFDKTKRIGKEKVKGEKGHSRPGQNHTTEAERATGEGATGDGGENGRGGGNIDDSQGEMPNGYARAQCAHDEGWI
jgi:hypothetical protein